MKTILYIFIIIPFFLFSQVGINTTTPQETLHVEGTLCVTNTSTKTPLKISGLDSNGTLTDVFIGPNLQLTGNVLSANSPTTTSSPTTYLTATVNLPPGSPGDEFDDLDMFVATLNANKVVFRLTGRGNSYDITGIAGGIDGRHLVLFNVEKVNMNLNDEDANSLPQNRIITLANNLGTSGQGTAELVYDGTLQRWVLIGFRD